MAKSISIWLLAWFYAWWETSYFGHNWFPKADAEVIADGIAMLLFALAIASYPNRQ